MTSIPIGIPLGTRLHHIRRHQTFWCLWIGVRDMQVPYEQWRGRYLRLDDDGHVWSVTVHDDYTEDEYQVK